MNNSMETNHLIRRLQSAKGYWYLASPYSKYPAGHGLAFREVCRAAGWLATQDISCLSPIAHTHPIAYNSGLDPLDHTLWLKFDKPMMDAACGVVIVMLESWQESYGVDFEMKEFAAQGKPIMFMEWPRKAG